MTKANISPPTDRIRAIGMTVDQLAWLGARLIENKLDEYAHMNQTTLCWFLEQYAPYSDSDVFWKPIPDGTVVTFYLQEIIIDSSVSNGIILFKQKGEINNG
jgi:hypothetical protein